MIVFEVEDEQGVKKLEVPEDINLNLMEVLKAYEYGVLATCGGMALCATCHVLVEKEESVLAEMTDPEMDMLDTLPDASPVSRLACQIKVDASLNGARFKLRPFEA